MFTSVIFVCFMFYILYLRFHIPLRWKWWRVCSYTHIICLYYIDRAPHERDGCGKQKYIFKENVLASNLCSMSLIAATLTAVVLHKQWICALCVLCKFQYPTTSAYMSTAASTHPDTAKHTTHIRALWHISFVAWANNAQQRKMVILQLNLP